VGQVSLIVPGGGARSAAYSQCSSGDDDEKPTMMMSKMPQISFFVSPRRRLLSARVRN